MGSRRGSPAWVLLPAAVAVAICTLVPARVGAAPVRPVAPSAGALLFDLPVPGGLANLLAAARLAPAPRPVALLSLIRVLYASAATGTRAAEIRNAIESTLGNPGAAASSPSDSVPLPLSAEVWTGTIFKGTVASDRLLYAVLRDKRASLLYYGLLSVDEPTLEYLDTHRPLLAAIYDQGVGPFATCARSIHVRNGVIVLPGGPGALAAWEDIVGERASAPDRFILALINGDQGRRAYFLDVVTHLDAARQAFALEAASPERLDKLRSLYSSIVGFERRFWRVDLWPFVRQALDPAIVLTQVEATADGRMKAPSGLAFWRAALDGNEGACARLKPQDGEPSVDAAWLVDRLMGEPTDTRRLLLHGVLFAQRVFSSDKEANGPAACKAVANFRTFSGLFLTLEHIGLADPRDYLAAVQFARAIGSPNDARSSLLGISQLQGILAFLDSMAATSPSDRATAQALVRSLFALPASSRPDADPGGPAAAASLPLDRLALWMREVLLFKLCGTADGADTCLQEAAVGAHSNNARPTIEWEGERYRIDPAHAANLRLSEVRKRQESIRFDTALQLFAIGEALRDQPFSQSAASQQAAILGQIASGLGNAARTVSGGTLDSVRTQLQRTARQLASARQKPATAAAEVFGASQVLLSDAWSSFAYAIAIGDIDSAFLLADDPARRHDFGVVSAKSLDLVPAWQLAHEEWHKGTGWTVKGALLGLPRACALSWPRRLSIEPIAVKPTLNDLELHGFAQSVAALNAFTLTDTSRASIVAAIARGRAIVKAVEGDPDSFASLATGVGVSEWRVRGAMWLVRREPGAVADLFSLAELLWLGNPDAPRPEIDAWGVPSAALDGSLTVRMPSGHAWEDFGGRGAGSLSSCVADLNLRTAVWLHQAKLPSMLLPGIVSFATWDLTTGARPADVDDFLAVVSAAQSFSIDNFADYVSALTTDGTLVPVPKG